MVQTISIEQVTLYDLERTFKLQETDAADFFPEWQESLPGLTAEEVHRLERVAAAYRNLEHRSVLENTVKLAVVAPLLDLAGFFLPPFYVTTETSIEIVAKETEVTLRGRMDVLVLKDQIWVLVIESKRAEFSLKVGIPQVLAYMLASPNPTQPLYGMVTNGSSFIFLKLLLGKIPCFGRSKEFLLGQDEGLERTLQVMKKLAAIVNLT